MKLLANRVPIMRNLPGHFTMRKQGFPTASEDWFRIVNKKNSNQADVYIYDEIGFWGTNASDFVQEIKDLDVDKINLHLNSPGGQVFDGLAIYNSLKQHDAEVHVFVDALAASAASFIAQAGDTITMARNARMMIHDGMGICIGNESDMLETAQLLSDISDNIADIYAYRAGGTVEEWRDLMREEVWYSAKEAVDAGLADEMTDPDKDAEEESNKWDLSFFNYAGRDKAESPVRVKERLLVQNRAKENQMGKGKSPVKNQGEGDQSNPDPVTSEDPPTDQPDSQTTGDPEEQGSEAQTETPPVEDQPVTEPATPPADPSNSAVNGVMISGKLVTDFSVIQNYVNTLNTAQREAEEQHRRDFVESLSNDNKIAATQVDKLTAFALKLSPEQFSDWAASYDDAPSQALFQQHGGDQPQNTPDNEADSTADRISTLQGIVAMHERTMTPEKVKQTNSYIELQQLLGKSS